MSAAVLSPLVTKPMTAEEVDDDDIMMNLFESTAAPNSSNPQEEESSKDDISIPSLSQEDTDVVMEDVEEPPAPAFGGLRNLGNTCYLNSATQMLASLDEFRGALEASAPVTEDDDKLKLRDEFLKLIQSLQEGETVRPDAFKKAVDERSPLFVGYRQQDAHEFLTTLLDLLDEAYQAPEATNDSTDDDTEEESKVTEDEKKPESSDSEPTVKSDQDENSSNTPPPIMKLTSLPSFSELKVDEISQLLHGEEKKQETPVPTRPEEPHCKLVGGRAVVADGPQLQEASVPVAPTQPAPESRHLNTVSPVDDFFATEVRSRLTCDSCKYSRCQIEKYLHLSIDISENGSVEEGLRKFFAPEKREIKCEKCFCETATQTMEIAKLPQALLFHFKRFIVDVSPDYSSITYRKDQSSVDFPDSLSLDLHSILRDLVADDATVRGGTNYQIRSIVNHIGSSASCGHYTADASRDYGGGERGWTRFNDSTVTRISSNEAMSKSSNAYMVMYELE